MDNNQEDRNETEYLNAQNVACINQIRLVDDSMRMRIAIECE